MTEQQKAVKKVWGTLKQALKTNAEMAKLAERFQQEIHDSMEQTEDLGDHPFVTMAQLKINMIIGNNDKIQRLLGPSVDYEELIAQLDVREEELFDGE